MEGRGDCGGKWHTSGEKKEAVKAAKEKEEILSLSPFRSLSIPFPLLSSTKKPAISLPFLLRHLDHTTSGKL